MTTNLDHLEAAAKAATPGPWKSDLRVGIAAIYTAENNPNCLSNVPDHDRICAINGVYADVRWNMTEQQESNAAYIAAVNPAVVLELVAELRAEREKYANAVKSYKSVVQEAAWLAFQVYKPRRRCPPLQECDTDDIVTEKDCQQCWLNAAREAVEKEAKE